MNQTELVNKLVELSIENVALANENLINQVTSTLMWWKDSKNNGQVISLDLVRSLDLLEGSFKQLEKASNQYRLALEDRKDLTMQSNSQS